MAQVVTWGNGETTIGRFKPNGVVTSAEIIELTESRLVYRYHYSVTFQSQWTFNRFNGVGTWGQTTRTFYFDRKVNNLKCRVSTSNTNPFAGSSQTWNYSPAPPVFISDSSEYPYANLSGRWVHAWVKASDNLGFGNALSGVCTNTGRQPVVNGWVLVNSISSSADPVRPFSSGGAIISITPTCGNSAQYEVVNAGQCAVRITYANGQTQQINLSSCPQWARVEDDQACPAGSCECVHGSEKCCFDPSSGELVKKIRLV